MTLLEIVRNLWVIILFGVILLLLGSHILIRNEGFAVEALLALDETMEKLKSSGLTEQANSDFIANDNVNKDRIVYISGPIVIGEPLTEPDYNIQVQAVKLTRHVQMYQWIEDVIQNDYVVNNDIMQVEDDSKRSYYYRCEWRDKIEDWNSFRFPNGHENPKSFPLKSMTHFADAVYIGQYELGNKVKEFFHRYKEITSDSRPDDSNIKLHAGIYYHTQNIFRPQVGDIRVRFTAAGLEGETYSMVGKLDENNLVVPYITSRNKSVLLLTAGELTMDEVFLLEHRNQRWITWSVRFIGWLIIYFGVSCNSKVLHFLLKRVSLLAFLAPDLHYPFRGNVVLACFVALLIASLAWVFYRPMIGFGLVLAAFSPFIWFYQTIFISY